MQPEAFVAYLQRRSGDDLRAVGIYADDDVELWYCRDDLDAELVEATLREFHTNVTWTSSSEDRLEQHLGPKRGSVQLREQGVVLNLGRADVDEGALVCFERTIARALGEFTRECLQYLYPD